MGTGAPPQSWRLSVNLRERLPYRRPADLERFLTAAAKLL